MDESYQIGNTPSSPLLPARQTTLVPMSSMVANMATRTKIRKGPAAHLYIKEWSDDRGLSDEQIGTKLGVARETVFRWRTEQNRLNPEKIAALAGVLELEPWELYRQPGRRSLDALMKDASDEVANMAFDVVKRLKDR